MTDIYSEILKNAEYALASKSRDLVYKTLGMAEIARLLRAISIEQYAEFREMLIKNGLNNPEAGLI